MLLDFKSIIITQVFMRGIINHIIFEYYKFFKHERLKIFLKYFIYFFK